MAPIPILDLTRIAPEIQSEIEEAVLRVVRSGRYILGPEVSEFECEMAGYLGVQDVVGLSSGTDALLAALMAIGIGPGDAVALPVYSFFATAGVVSRLGATPVFVDVEPTHQNIDVDALQRVLEQRDDVKAVIGVHLYGAAVDVARIEQVCAAHDIPWIEDAAQAIGTKLDGKLAGGFGLAGCFSTFPTKNLGGAGDGGFLSTNDAEFGKHVRSLRNHGQSDAYRHTEVGGNFRLDAMQAAVLRVKLKHIEAFTEARRANAQRYREQFAAAGVEEHVRLPVDVDRHAYHQFVTHVGGGKRDKVLEHLRSRQIGCAVYYPLPFHMQPCFADLGYAEGDFPVAEQLAAENVALPIYPEHRDAEIDTVVAAFAEALRG